MPKITVHIAPVGNPLLGGGTSKTGHMWFTLTDDFGNDHSYGFAPRSDGDPWGPGKLYDTDDKHYIDPPYNYERQITQAQYDKITTWTEQVSADAESGKGRWAEYSGLWNSCVDFTWEALNRGGLADAPEGGWQGNLLPWFNRWAVEKAFYDKDPLRDSINDAVSATFTAAQRWLPRRDPLTFDLDGDGLETVGTSAGILFDMDGDGIKNGTGWIQPDDGFLVLDRNNNGSIDNGTELFGDSTPLYAGGTASDGFAALAQEDTNHDGKVSAGDQRWNQLRIWQDLNQNGLTESGELKSLSSLGITGINVAATDNSQVLNNGNQLADLGSYTRSDGTTGDLGQVAGMADVNLVADTFHRSFPDSVAISEAAQPLPDMQGSGVLRDLREASSQSAALAAKLAQYASATTREEQLALLDDLLLDWADTGGMASTFDARTPANYIVHYKNFGAIRRADHCVLRLSDGTVMPVGNTTSGEGGSSLGGVDYRTSDLAPLSFIDDYYRGVIEAWSRKIHVLESFNGRYFFAVPVLPDATDPNTWKSAVPPLTSVTGILMNVTNVEVPPPSGGGTSMAVPLPVVDLSYGAGQLDLLTAAYESLRTSVYDALLLQTRFKPLLDLIELQIDESGIRLDYSKLEARFWDKIAHDPAKGMSDLIEFNRATKDMIAANAWSGEWMMDKAANDPLWEMVA